MADRWIELVSSAFGKVDTAIWVAVVTGVFGFGRILWLRNEERSRMRTAIISELQGLMVHYRLTIQGLDNNGLPQLALRLKLAKAGERLFLRSGYLERAGISKGAVMRIAQLSTLLRNNDLVIDEILHRLQSAASVDELLSTLRNRFVGTDARLQEVLTSIAGVFGLFLVRGAGRVANRYGDVESAWR